MSHESPSNQPKSPGLRTLGIAVISMGAIGLLFGQVRFELQLLTNFGNSDTVYRAIIWLALIAVSSVMLWMLGRWLIIRSDDQNAGPEALFFQLCKAHAIESEEISYLENIANRLSIDNAGKLFVDPRFLNSLADENARDIAEREGEAIFGDSDRKEIYPNKLSMLSRIFGLGAKSKQHEESN